MQKRERIATVQTRLFILLKKKKKKKQKTHRRGIEFRHLFRFELSFPLPLPDEEQTLDGGGAASSVSFRSLSFRGSLHWKTLTGDKLASHTQYNTFSNVNFKIYRISNILQRPARAN